MTDEAKQELQKLTDVLREKQKYVDKLVRQEYEGTLDSEEVSEGLYDTLDEVFYQVFEGIKNAIKKGQLFMTTEEKLREQLKVAVQAMYRMQAKTLDLGYEVEMEEFSVSKAFDDLTDCVVETSNKAMTEIDSIEKAYKG